MKFSAINKALADARRAQMALQRLEASTELRTTQEEWAEFLKAAGAIYFKLETGSRGCKKSEAWFRTVKARRKEDPLLQYIHQARNSDEHGIEEITAIDTGGISISGDFPMDGGGLRWRTTHNVEIGPDGEPHLKVNHTILENTVGVSSNPNAKPLEVKIVEAHVRLIPVRNSIFGDIFNPPSEHFDEPLLDQSPANIAGLGLLAAFKFIAEAQQLPIRN
jgi:hypothetical protein